MNKRWTKKIDISMGDNRLRARKWGRQAVTIHWNPSPGQTKAGILLRLMSPQSAGHPGI